MKIVCDHCGVTGDAADVRVDDGTVVVVCAACGQPSTLGPRSPEPWENAAAAPADAGGDTAAPTPAEPEAAAGGTTAETDPNQPSPPSAKAAAEAAEPAASSPPAADVAVVEQGPLPVHLAPVKCPKCGHRQYDERACHTCGLVFAKAAGDRPWERVEPGKEAVTAKAEERWQHVVTAPSDPGRHAEFVEFCRQNGLTRVAARNYRHWLADHPNDRLSKNYLDQVVKDAQVVAQAFAVGDAETFARNARRLRTVLGLIVALLCFAAAAIMLKLVAVQGNMSL